MAGRSGLASASPRNTSPTRAPRSAGRLASVLVLRHQVVLGTSRPRAVECQRLRSVSRCVVQGASCASGARGGFRVGDRRSFGERKPRRVPRETLGSQTELHAVYGGSQEGAVLRCRRNSRLQRNLRAPHHGKTVAILMAMPKESAAAPAESRHRASDGHRWM